MARAIGLGGGGNMVWPAVSPHLDANNLPNLIFVNCDMTGLYRSRNVGADWTMVESDGMTATTRCAVAFHPTDPKTIYGYWNWLDPKEIRISTDGGDSWTSFVTLPIASAANMVTSIIVLPTATGNPRVIFGTNLQGVFEVLYGVGGQPNTAQAMPSTVGIGDVLRFVYFTQNNIPFLFLATTTQVFQLAFGPNQWQPLTWSGQPVLPPPFPTVAIGGNADSPCGIDINNRANVNYGSAIEDFAGSTDGANFSLYLSIMTTATSTNTAQIAGGLYIFDTAMASPAWVQVPFPGTLSVIPVPNTTLFWPTRYDWLSADQVNRYQFFVTLCGPNGERDVLAVSKPQTSAPWTSKSIFNNGSVTTGWEDQDLGTGFGGAARGFALCPTNSSVAVFTNAAALYITTDGGATWTARQSKQLGLDAKNQPWTSNGIEVTTCWDYAIDPFKSEVQYICYTDIGLARSDDAGGSWRHIPLVTSRDFRDIYQIAMDRVNSLAVGGGQLSANVFVACSTLHDLPYYSTFSDQANLVPWRQSNPGALFWSNQGGTVWQEIGQGLDGGPVVSVVLTSDAQALFVAVYGSGVWRGTKTNNSWLSPAWTKEQILPNAYRLHIEPGGTVFCTVAGNSSAPGANILRRLLNGTWQPIKGNLPIPAGQLELDGCPIDLWAVDAATVILCMTDMNSGKGGVFVSLNADAANNANVNWTDVTPPTYLHEGSPYHRAFAAFVDSNNVYITTTYNGIWVKPLGAITNGTVLWTRYKPIPYLGAHRILFFNGDQYITSFGGGASLVPGNGSGNPRQVYPIMIRDEFSKNEVNTTPGKSFSHSFMIVFDAFLSTELGMANATDGSNAPTITFSTDAAGVHQIPATQVAAVASAQAIPEVNSSNARQRIAFDYQIQFGRNSDLLFPAAGDAQIWMTAKKYPYTTATELHLKAQISGPYILHGETWYLSDDTCAFKVRDGDTLFGVKLLTTGQGSPTVATNATDYIQKVLANLNVTQDPAAIKQFDVVRTDAIASNLRWSTLDNGAAVFNFALARVHFPADPSRTQYLDPVAVFFRLCNTALTGLDYQGNAGIYASGVNDATLPIPFLGLNSSGELATFPCFAEPRVATGLKLQHDGKNAVQAFVPNSTTDTVAYFGCLLDFNQSPPPIFPDNPPDNVGPFNTGTSIQGHIKNDHQCLIVQISYAADPITAPTSPSTSDKLAQRNLMIDWSANPGKTATHTLQTTFAIRATGPSNDRRRLSRVLYPQALNDELFIDWRNIPPEAEVTLYLPDLPVDQILRLMQVEDHASRLEKLDEFTLRCFVGRSTYIPLPSNRNADIPAFITVVLPDNVRKGQHFRAVISQVAAPERRIIGTFELSIPVSTASELLENEERRLALLKYVNGSIVAGTPWSKIFSRFIAQVSARVDGFGGDAAAVPPSPNGGPIDQPGACGCFHAEFIHFRGCIQQGGVWHFLKCLLRLLLGLVRCLLR